MPECRVVIFSTAYAPLIGGAEIAVREITDRLSDFEFVLITARIKPELAPEEIIGRVKVLRVGKGNWFDKIRLWRDGWKVARTQGKFDVVWGIMASYGGLAALRFKKRNASVLSLLTLQEGDSFEHIYRRAFLIWPWFKQIFTHADKIQAISNYLAEWAKKMGAKCAIDVVPNGVAFLSSESHGEKVNIDKKIILSVSRLVKKNGLEYVIRAMNGLPEDCVLQIVGEGDLRPKLERMIKESKLSNRVTLLGEVPNQELPKYYAQADVFVRPSLSEGLGIAFLEAMQENVPVIATPVGGIPDFLKVGETGWFCKVRDPEDIAEKIKYVLDEKNKEEVKRVVENARKLVERKYSWEIIAQQMQKLFLL